MFFLLNHSLSVWIVESVQVVVKFCFRHQDDDDDEEEEEEENYNDEADADGDDSDDSEDEEGLHQVVSRKEYSLVKKIALTSLKPNLLFSYFCDRTLFDWLDDRSLIVQEKSYFCTKQSIRFKKLLWNCCSMSNIVNPFLYSMYEYGPPIISFNSWRLVASTKCKYQVQVQEQVQCTKCRLFEREKNFAIS